jgi:hypothetical protein
MKADVHDIILKLNGISSVEDEDELRKLEEALNSMAAAERPEYCADALLRLYERFPDSDGDGIFWSIVHLLESLPGYEMKLVESARRRPSGFGLLMLNRILNAGRTHVGSTDILSLLGQVAGNKPDRRNQGKTA